MLDHICNTNDIEQNFNSIHGTIHKLKNVFIVIQKRMESTLREAIITKTYTRIYKGCNQQDNYNKWLQINYNWKNTDENKMFF